MNEIPIAPPGMVWTTRGFMAETDLVKTTGSDDDPEGRWSATWTEWRSTDGEMVKREPHVIIHQGAEIALVHGDIG